MTKDIAMDIARPNRKAKAAPRRARMVAGRIM